MSLKEKISECDELYSRNDFKGLILKCDEILERYPDNQNAVGYKGISLCFLDEYDEAIRVLSEGIERYPDNYYLKNNLAMVYYDLGEYEKSLKLCEEGLKIKEFDWLCENKFKNLIKLGRIDDAIEFEKSVSDDINMQVAFLDDDLKEHELDYYSHILRDNPDNLYVIELVKAIVAHRYPDRTPDVGDYYLNWIDCVKFADAKLYAECEDSKLKEYVEFEIHCVTSILKEYPKGCGLDEFKERLVPYDEMEFDAFIKHLLELGYLIQPEEGRIELAEGILDHVDTVVDNSRLEELIMQDITPQMEMGVFALLKDARLFLPVDFGPDALKGIEDSKPGDKIEGPE